MILQQKRQLAALDVQLSRTLYAYVLGVSFALRIRAYDDDDDDNDFQISNMAKLFLRCQPKVTFDLNCTVLMMLQI